MLGSKNLRTAVLVTPLFFVDGLLLLMVCRPRPTRHRPSVAGEAQTAMSYRIDFTKSLSSQHQSVTANHELLLVGGPQMFEFVYIGDLFW